MPLGGLRGLVDGGRLVFGSVDSWLLTTGVFVVYYWLLV